MANIKDLEGSVSIEDDITPITRKPINQVNASSWNNMTVGELIEQRATLESRLILAHQSGHAEMATQIRRGINSLDVLISRLQTDDIGLT